MNKPRKSHPIKDPLNLSVMQFAAAQTPPISRQRVNELCNRGDLVRDDAGKISLVHPVNAAWLSARQGCPPPTTPPGRWAGEGRRAAQPERPPRPVVQQPVYAAQPGYAAPTGDDPLDEETITDALAQLLSFTDIRTMPLADVQKARQIEVALKTRVERQHKRRELIERSLVRTVFGRLYTIDAQELRTLGGKLSPEVAGLFGIEDPALILAVEQRIDGEILKSLAHIRRVINDFLTGVGSEVIE
jgi:hypothetical protein